MVEEVRIPGYYPSAAGDGGRDGVDGDGDGDGDADDERVMEWEVGLPNVDDLYPLSQSLISAEMLSAFSITPEPYRNMTDVNRASQNTLSNLRGESETTDLDLGSRKLRRVDSGGDGDGGGAVEEIDGDDEGEGEGDGDGDDSSAKASKRPRLVWTPQLHKRFVDVVARLGVKKAVPKTIMQMMNVEGLSRENVASHLQKYRLYLKRMQGVSNHGNSSNDRLFASTPAPHDSSGGGGGNGYRHHAQEAIPMPYPPPQMVYMPYQPPQMVPHQFESNSYPYWSGNSFGYQQRMTPNEK